jgi:outer membrane protein assembly factor BamB
MDGTTVLVPLTQGLASFDTATLKLQWYTPVCPDPHWAETIRQVALATVYLKCDTTVYAVSSVDGKTLWSTSLIANVDFFRSTATTVAIGYDTQLDVIDAATGRVRWSQTLTPTGHPIDLDDTRLYLAQLSDLVALDATTGHQIWTRPIAAGWLTADGDDLFIRLVGHSMACVDAATGADCWPPTPVDDQLTHSYILGVTAGRVIVESGTGLLLAYDAATGAQSWTSTAAIDVASARVGGGKVVVGSDSGLSMLDAATGVVTSTDQQPAGTPSIEGGRVAYVGDGDLVIRPLK